MRAIEKTLNMVRFRLRFLSCVLLFRAPITHGVFFSDTCSGIPRIDMPWKNICSVVPVLVLFLGAVVREALLLFYRFARPCFYCPVAPHHATMAFQCCRWRCSSFFCCLSVPKADQCRHEGRLTCVFIILIVIFILFDREQVSA